MSWNDSSKTIAHTHNLHSTQIWQTFHKYHIRNWQWMHEIDTNFTNLICAANNINSARDAGVLRASGQQRRARFDGSVQVVETTTLAIGPRCAAIPASPFKCTSYFAAKRARERQRAGGRTARPVLRPCNWTLGDRRRPQRSRSDDDAARVTINHRPSARPWKHCIDLKLLDQSTAGLRNGQNGLLPRGPTRRGLQSTYFIKKSRASVVVLNVFKL